MHFDYLASSTLHMVDIEVTNTQVNAGWVFLDGGLSAMETLTDGEVEITVKIHPKIQAINHQAEFFLANDVIEFIRC